MTSRLVTEIITFRSLQELVNQIESEISSYRSQKEKYSERLGSFLREAEEKYGDEDWFKQLSLDKLPKARRRSRRGRRKSGEAEEWIPFKSMFLSSKIRGEAEIMFEAIGAINDKLDELEEAKTSVEELRNLGLGNEVKYTCFLRDGVVNKIVLKPVDADAEGTFKFSRSFTVIRALQP